MFLTGHRCHIFLTFPFKSQTEKLCQVFWAQCSVFVKLLACSCRHRTMWNCALCTTEVLNEVITNPSSILHPWCHVRRDVFRKTIQDCIVLYQWPGPRLNRVFPVKSENRSNTSQASADNVVIFMPQHLPRGSNIFFHSHYVNTISAAVRLNSPYFFFQENLYFCAPGILGWIWGTL